MSASSKTLLPKVHICFYITHTERDTICLYIYLNYFLEETLTLTTDLEISCGHGFMNVFATEQLFIWPHC